MNAIKIGSYLHKQFQYKTINHKNMIWHVLFIFILIFLRERNPLQFLFLVYIPYIITIHPSLRHMYFISPKRLYTILDINLKCSKKYLKEIFYIFMFFMDFIYIIQRNIWYFFYGTLFEFWKTIFFFILYCLRIDMSFFFSRFFYIYIFFGKYFLCLGFIFLDSIKILV